MNSRYPILGVDRVEAFGPAIKDIRTSQGRKTAWLANMSGTTISHLRQWEKANRLMTTRSLMGLLVPMGYQVALMHADDFHTLLNGSTRSRGYLDDLEDNDA